MSARVIPMSSGTAVTLESIALRASSDVPPRHRPDKSLISACALLAESLGDSLNETEAMLLCQRDRLMRLSAGMGIAS